jgi:signal transduction histidine kinase
VKHWPIRSRLALWTAVFLTIELLIFGKPLLEVAVAAEQIDAKALSHRLPEPRTQDEVGRLVQVLNHSFDRLERSFEQATRFSSNASHELKTPLTIMRGEIESALKAEENNPRIQSLLDGLLAETQRERGRKMLLKPAIGYGDPFALKLRPFTAGIRCALSVHDNCKKGSLLYDFNGKKSLPSGWPKI